MPKGAKKHMWTLDNLQIEHRAAGDGQATEQPVIRGYAAVYNSESELLYGFFREVIRPGAFDSSLKNDIRCLFNHDSSKVLGRSTAGTLDIRSDAKGLYFEVEPPDAQWANDLCQSIKRGDINQMSFGFMTREDSWQDLEDGTVLRELLDVDLQEVSVVTFPAYQATSAGMRSIDSEDEEVKKRVEEREKDKPTGPEQRYLDYLKMINTFGG
jgi:HK97 family phage prohead protease